VINEERAMGTYPLIDHIAQCIVRGVSDMDPVSMVWDTLVTYFTTPFLASALVIGYLMFFLFFYKTEYWDSIDSLERFFFGFLVGIVTMVACASVSIPLALLLQSLYLEKLFTMYFYSIPVFFLALLMVLRVEVGAPLSSKKANGLLRAFLANHRFYWPYLLITVSVVAYLWLGWNNPFFNVASRYSWGDFILTLNVAVFVAFCTLTWFVIQLSSIPSKISMSTIIALPVEVLRFYLFSFHRKKKSVSIREEDIYWV
jgi:hypothetical protein